MALQELVCFFAQSSVFEDVSEMFSKIFPIKLSANQILRVSEWYGKQIDPIIEANHTIYIPELPRKKQDEETTYVMIDGSMVYTREEKWKEMKLGRIFHHRDNVKVSTKRKEVIRSVFVSHLGSVEAFSPKLERHLTPYRNLTFIGDGAKWIWNIVENNYPGARQILDFYHANEKLELFAKHHFRNQEKKSQWLHIQKELLLNDQVAEVIDQLKALKPRNVEARGAKEDAIHYYIEHEDRMMYKTYLQLDLLIGSGPIEAAHRKVIHQRLKLSGQRWSIPGAQATANLRCYKSGGHWNIIQNLLRLAA